MVDLVLARWLLDLFVERDDDGESDGDALVGLLDREPLAQTR